jgi:ABC-type antimicrobial peptide transport system permease subunit
MNNEQYTVVKKTFLQSFRSFLPPLRGGLGWGFYNLKIAIRNLQRNGLYSWINVVGLAVSIATVVFIMLWILHELSFDTFYRRSGDIYQVKAKIVQDGVDGYWRTPTALAYAARHDVPGVENACTVNPYYDLGYLEYQGKTFFGDRYITVDTTFFSIFDMTFIEGSAAGAFPDPFSVILTRTLARKIFGDEPAVGKAIIGGNGRELSEPYYVSAVVADCPGNTYIQYDAIFSFERSWHNNTWRNWWWDTYVLLRPGADAKDVGRQLTEIQHRNFTAVTAETFALQPLADLRLHAAGGKETGMASVRLFFIIACGLLVIACINYVNLTTARANKRSREMAVRKIMGAKKYSLFAQLMNETLVLCFVALVVAVLLVGLGMPYYNQLIGAQLDFSPVNPVVMAVCGITLLLVVLLSGIYPAMKLMTFRATGLFKPPASGGKSRTPLRKILVVVQFTGVAILLVTTIVINRQLHFIQHKSLGYDRAHVLVISTNTNLDIMTHFRSFKSDLKNEPDIMGVSGAATGILSAGYTENITWEGMPDNTEFPVQLWGADRDICPLLNIPLVEGSGFSGTPADSTLCYLNETAVRQMNLENPIGKRISMPDGNYTVAGVVRDFDHSALQQSIAPMVIYLPPYLYFPHVIYIKTQPGKTPEAIAAIERAWKKYNPFFPFEYRFLDDVFNELYAAEQQRQTLFSAFSLLAILISCLGLFGLVTYTAEQRTKEIGIRKVLGASVTNIIGMLSKEFLLLAGVALLVAFPVAWYLMEKMLQQYAYRIPLSWWIFALAGVAVILLTVLSVGVQAYRAATANPVKAIKTE